MPFHLCIPLAVTLVAALVYAQPRPDVNELQTTQQTAVFRSQIHNDTTLRYVKNSGICETTPGVTQYSGYMDVGTNMSMWFWFFEARNSPETAPFTLWLNGGPGCSSMVGLFVENGPCSVNEDGSSTRLNPYSWNNVSNMIYIDQPINAGFSYGTDTVNSTEAVAPLVWKAFQILFESRVFSKYASRELFVATESYGGHYGPAIVTYLEGQNTLIASGAIEGEHISVSGLLMNNGWYDPIIQSMAYYTFASNAPGYGPIQPPDVLENIFQGLYGPNGCIAQEQNCYVAGNSIESNEICKAASDYCTVNAKNDKVTDVTIGALDPFDLRQNSSAPFPPLDYFQNYLSIPEVVNQIGAETTFQLCSDESPNQFDATGDGARTWLPQLSELANSGMKILIWAGDLDILCCWIGAYNTVLAMDWYGNETLHSTPLSNITLDGTPVAAVANVDQFSFARVYAAGHEVPAFQPAAALKIFTQAINHEPLHSVW